MALSKYQRECFEEARDLVDEIFDLTADNLGVDEKGIHYDVTSTQLLRIVQELNAGLNDADKEEGIKRGRDLDVVERATTEGRKP